MKHLKLTRYCKSSVVTFLKRASSSPPSSPTPTLSCSSCAGVILFRWAEGHPSASMVCAAASPDYFPSVHKNNITPSHISTASTGSSLSGHDITEESRSPSFTTWLTSASPEGELLTRQRPGQSESRAQVVCLCGLNVGNSAGAQTPSGPADKLITKSLALLWSPRYPFPHGPPPHLQ